MQTNQHVTGSYCGGHVFSGTILAARPLTVPTDGCVEFTVSLDKPLDVFGCVRDHLLVHVKFDGAPSSYTRFSDYMQLG